MRHLDGQWRLSMEGAFLSSLKGGDENRYTSWPYVAGHHT